MANSNGVITAPVSIADIQQVLNTSINELISLCNHASINKWAKFKPVSLTTINLIDQWDASNNRWKTTATWWKGDRTSSTNYLRECGYQIPVVKYASEYRSSVYLNNILLSAYTAPTNCPTNPWIYLSRTVSRESDFAGYKHTGISTPLVVNYPDNQVIKKSDSGVFVGLSVNNYSERTNGNNTAIFANDMESLSGSEFCMKVNIRSTLGTNRTYELTGGSLSDASGGKTITLLRSMLEYSSTSGRETVTVAATPYMRKTINNTIHLLSLGLNASAVKTMVFNLPGNSYKMRYMIGEAQGASSQNDSIFSVGYSAQMAGYSFYPTEDSSSTTTTTGHYIYVNQLFAKIIVENIFSLSTSLSGPYTVNVYIEDLNSDDDMRCMIPKTRILSFTTQLCSTNSTAQGYGYHGTAHSSGTTAIEFADYRNTLSNWPSSYREHHVPIINHLGIDDPWPAGTALNPDNNILTRFRVVAEILSSSGIHVDSVADGGDGSFKKFDETKSQYTMEYYKTCYAFAFYEYGNNQYGVEQDPDVGISPVGLDYGEVQDDCGTTSWMPYSQKSSAFKQVYENE